MNRWRTAQLGDVCLRVTKGTTPTLGSGGFSANGVAFVKVESIAQDGRIDCGKLAYISNETHTLLGRSVLQVDDLLFSIAGTIGRVARVHQGLLPANTNQALAIVRPNPDLVDAGYLMYCLRDRERIHEAKSRVVQSVQANLSLTELSAVAIALPPLNEQRSIAGILGAFDDKIAVNTKIAATAMDLLLAHYGRLIMDVPTHVDTVENVVRRLVQRRKFVKTELSEMGEFPVFDQSEQGILGYGSGDGYLEASEHEPVLFFGDHTCKLRVSTERFAVGPNTVPFVGNGLPSLVLFCALQGVQIQEEYKRHWQGLMKKRVVLPNNGDAVVFASRFSGILGLRRQAILESQTLATARDALLPMLVSGKLRVRDAEKVLEGVF